MEEPLPPIELIPIASAKPQAAPLRSQQEKTTTDLRWVKVREFLSSRNLSPAHR